MRIATTVGILIAIGEILCACGRIGYEPSPYEEPTDVDASGGAGGGGIFSGLREPTTAGTSSAASATTTSTAGATSTAVTAGTTGSSAGSGGTSTVGASTGGSFGGFGGQAGSASGGSGGMARADAGADALVADAKQDAMSTAGPQKLAIPSYFNSSSLWSQLSQAAPTVGIAIVNPSSGVGFNVDSNLASSVDASQHAGVTVLGFVDTAIGARSSSAVQMEVDRYFQWYGVNGIFFNGASTDCAREPYYESLFRYVKSLNPKAVVVLNPGTTMPECFVAASDILVTYNDVFASYGAFRPVGWESAYPSTRFWHLVYATSSQDMQAAIALSKQRGAGWIYVTPDDLPNPWDSLPPDLYWSAELAAAAGR